jgi:hypothetical protein
MSYPEDKNEPDHWHALAEEFGLPPEPAPKSEAAKKPAPPAQAEALPPKAVEVPALMPGRPLAPEPSAARVKVLPFEPALPSEPESAGFKHRSAQPIDEETTVAEPAMQELAASDSIKPHRAPEGNEGLEDRPRRGRRRGRRSEKSRREQEGESRESGDSEGAGDEPAKESPAADQPVQERRRGRGRSRGEGKRIETANAPDTDEDEGGMEEVPEDAAQTEDEADEEEISFANWTVPSWQELIASLYRPER